MTSAHSQYNYNRRNSSATPYTIPIKHQHQHHHTQQYHHQPSKSHQPLYLNGHGHGHGYSHSHSVGGYHSSPYQQYLSPPYQQSFQPQYQYQSPPHQKYMYEQSGFTEKAHSHPHRRHSQTPLGRPDFKTEYDHINVGDEIEYEDDEVDGAMMSSSVPTLSREFVVRRISEGESGRLKQELKCEACGKGYKHISSLAKHLWEHTPEWNVTKKLLISKHQQVQLLEAASILVGMNEISEGSRRNSVFQEDDTNGSDSSKTPTPPMHATEPSSNESLKDNYRYNRSNSISQYPPSSQYLSATNTFSSTPKVEPGVQYLSGGYLDNNAGTAQTKQEQNEDHDQGNTSQESNENYGLHSRSNSESINKPPTPFNSSTNISPKKSNDSFNDDIIGKME